MNSESISTHPETLTLCYSVVIEGKQNLMQSGQVV